MIAIEERMRNIHQRMQVEKTFGISAAQKELFLARYQELEAAGALTSTGHSEEVTGSHEVRWGLFDSWHDAPSTMGAVVLWDS